MLPSVDRMNHAAGIDCAAGNMPSKFISLRGKPELLSSESAFPEYSVFFKDLTEVLTEPCEEIRRSPRSCYYLLRSELSPVPGSLR